MLKSLILATLLSSATCLGATTPKRVLNASNESESEETITTTIGGVPESIESYNTSNGTYAYKETLQDSSIYNFLSYYNYTNYSTESVATRRVFNQITYMQLSYYKGVRSASNEIKYTIGWFNKDTVNETYLDLSYAFNRTPTAYLVEESTANSLYVNNNTEYKATPINENFYDCNAYCNDSYKLEGAVSTEKEYNQDNTVYWNTITITLPQLLSGNYALYLKWNVNITGLGITLEKTYTAKTTKVELTSVLTQQTSFTYEVIDIPGLMLNILTMPWTFISSAFNVTLFPSTPYQVNIANLIKGILAIMSVLFIIKLFTRGFDALGNYVGGHQERAERIKTSKQQRELRAKEDARRERQQTNRDNKANK